MDLDKSVTAVVTEVEPEDYTLTVNIIGSGSVTKTPDRSTYESGTDVALRAIASSGWRFSRWQGGASGTSRDVAATMDDDKTVTAVFRRSSGPTPPPEAEDKDEGLAPPEAVPEEPIILEPAPPAAPELPKTGGSQASLLYLGGVLAIAGWFFRRRA